MALQPRLSKLVSVSGDPHRLALAFALGVLLGVLPGTGAFVAAGVATGLQMNVPLAVAGALVINPLTAPIMYGASFLLGRWMLGDEVAKHLIVRIGLTTAAGNVILAFALAVAGYTGVLLFTLWLRSKKGRRASRR
ncbi:MAG: DUF2062 domain-containing protein [Candidatus Omnitrophota bacterium]|nr:DUF2062 domain-containing protein [Candidatus Omnitrophota bacterium]